MKRYGVQPLVEAELVAALTGASLEVAQLKLHAAVFVFTQRAGCSAKEIAETLDIPLNSVYHLAKQPKWDKALNTLQYAGERAFKSEKRRDTLRDSGDLVARARELYLEQRWDSRTHKQAVSVVCETLDLKRRRVNEWAAKFGWEGDV